MVLEAILRGEDIVGYVNPDGELATQAQNILWLERHRHGALPDGWERHWHSGHGLHYFWNMHTRASQWEFPVWPARRVRCDPAV